jgi:hypothetical protein
MIPGTTIAGITAGMAAGTAPGIHPGITVGMIPGITVLIIMAAGMVMVIMAVGTADITGTTTIMLLLTILMVEILIIHPVHQKTGIFPDPRGNIHPGMEEVPPEVRPVVMNTEEVLPEVHPAVMNTEEARPKREAVLPLLHRRTILPERGSLPEIIHPPAVIQVLVHPLQQVVLLAVAVLTHRPIQVRAAAVREVPTTEAAVAVLLQAEVATLPEAVPDHPVAAVILPDHRVAVPVHPPVEEVAAAVPVEAEDKFTKDKESL